MNEQRINTLLSQQVEEEDVLFRSHPPYKSQKHKKQSS